MERMLRAKDKKITVVGETVDLGDMVDKIDEIVKWINEHEKREKD